jgi:serine/threonine protein kinase
MVIGTKLGPYEIVAPLGEGGMGDVYRARDTRLDRVVRTCLAKDPAQRFQTALDLKRALQWSTSPGGEPQSATWRSRPWPWMIVAAMATAVALVAAGSWVATYLRRIPPVEPRAIHLNSF